MSDMSMSNVRIDTIEEFVVYYADSFGQRSDRYGASSSLDDSVATSFSQLKLSRADEGALPQS